MPVFDDIVRAEQALSLGFVERAVNARDYATQLVETDDPTRLPELVVALGHDDGDRPRTLQLMFIPTDGEFEHTRFLQMWAPLPYRASADGMSDLRAAVTIVNQHVALGGFGLADDGALHFRHVLAIPRYGAIDEPLIGEVVAFVDFQQEHFGDYLEGVCDGEIHVGVLASVISQAE